MSRNVHNGFNWKPYFSSLTVHDMFLCFCSVCSLNAVSTISCCYVQATDYQALLNWKAIVIQQLHVTAAVKGYNGKAAE